MNFYSYFKKIFTFDTTKMSPGLPNLISDQLEDGKFNSTIKVLKITSTE